ncbi:putative indoleamine 2,3-dioxygenase [Podospora australis]|uniref:Indoleamine 2,3-dioxygenase n=1 Tax=Podospora australis TaxID=1536484 RepID=A0AAN6WKU7_9PEZI|nr:putative indoleamine 2,3-dioxygenase [Podospora australis]
MSPCEPLPIPTSTVIVVPGEYTHDNFLESVWLEEEFSVTSNAFLPKEQPLTRLPHPYYQPWENLIEHLSRLLQNGTLRQKVGGLPVLSIELLSTEAELRRGYVVLAFLTHAYVWGGSSPSEILPPQIAVPLQAISSRLNMPPVATYAAVNLWNYHSSSSDFSDLDSLQALHTFTGTEDESWFFMVSVAMEAVGGHIIPVMLSALQNSSHPDKLAAALGEITQCIRVLGKILDRMDERCDPNVFYHRIRPFLAGSKNMVSCGLPKGVFYSLDGSDKNGEWKELRGGSNGQSSLIQLFDILLGVEHKTGSPDTKGESFHQEVRGYMPDGHRRFLEFVENKYPGGLRTAVEIMASEDDNAQQEDVKVAFREATNALAEFRNKHLQIVARYIIIPSRQASQRGAGLVKNLATISASETKKELTGTGGTALLPFLKQSRDGTFRAGDFCNSSR